jgi:hypothetical protein
MKPTRLGASATSRAVRVLAFSKHNFETISDTIRFARPRKRSFCAATPSGTVLLRICWKTDMIFAPFRNS